MKTTIKILKDTPFDRAGTELSISDFRLKYSYVCSKDTPDSALIAYLKHEKILQDCYYTDNATGNWFEVVEIDDTPKFKEGDWVWHEEKREAFQVVIHDLNYFQPDFVTVEAANKYTDTWKRLATKEEIENFKLVPYLNKKVLIGKMKCYYFDNIWREIIGVYER